MKDIQKDHMKGILFMLLASLFFAFNDALVKYVVKETGENFSIFNIVFFRGIITCVLIILLIFFFGKLDLKRLFINKRSYLRGIFEVFAALCFLSGLILMPMADVYTLLNTASTYNNCSRCNFFKRKSWNTKMVSSYNWLYRSFNCY